jgi:hypothetical protein
VPEKEFEETEHKAAALRRAIEDAVAPPSARSAGSGSKANEPTGAPA